MPNFNGALKIYNLVIHRLFKKYENDITNFQNKASNFIDQNMAAHQGQPIPKGFQPDMNLASNLPNK